MYYRVARRENNWGEDKMNLKKCMLPSLFSIVLLGVLPGCGDSATDLPASDTAAAVSETGIENTDLSQDKSDVMLNTTEIEAVLADAQEKLQIGSERGFGWTTTADLLAQAEQALEKGELERANELSVELSKQALASTQQASHSDAHWMESIPR